MIPTVRLMKSGICSTRLGFGTSRLHHLRSTRARQDLLAEAAEVGILHFDTAPAYGDGLAERELGRFLQRRPGNFIVATKFGIPPSRLIEACPPLATPLRATRALFRRLGIWHEHLPALIARDLRRSLQESLTRLRLDHVDILLLHDPTLQRLPHPQELLLELEKLQVAGLIGAFGLAGPRAAIAPIVATHPALAKITQVGEAEWTESDPFIPDITFGAIARGPQHRFSAKIDESIARQMLKAALARRPNGTVLVSTTNREHLRLLAQVAAESGG